MTPRAGAAAGHIPVIDIGGLRTGTASDHRRIAAEIGAAARSVGFFCVAGHGLSRALVAQAFAQAHAFFTLPDAEKARVASHGAFRGFTGAAALANGDVHESFDLGVELGGDEIAALGDRPLVSGNRWPELPGFRVTLTACFDESLAVFAALHRAIAVDLGADPEFFTPLFGRNHGMRLSWYPPLAEPRAGLGASPHTDFGNLTLLAEDAPGLEICDRDGTWLPIAASPDALVCNIGDCLMRWSNDTYRSTLHRVVNPAARPRVSIGFFANADLATVVEPLPSCVGPGRPPAYPPIEFGAYMEEKFARGYRAETLEWAKKR
jgi:isopenicillin N synthase-like dioxygenase